MKSWKKKSRALLEERYGSREVERRKKWK